MKSIFFFFIFATPLIKNVFGGCFLEKGKTRLFCKNTNIEEVLKHKGSGAEDIEIHNLTVSKFSNKQLLLTKVKKLTFLYCNFKFLSNSLDNMQELEELRTNFNIISELPNDLFLPVEKLHTLDFSHNEIKNITLDYFYNLKNLKSMDLSHNEIEDLPLGIFDAHPMLENLCLENNLISNLELGVLDTMANLLKLDLSYNNVNNISLGLFDKSNHITTLNLKGNAFKIIILGVFDSLEDLTILNLAHNNIIHFSMGIFDELKRLEELDISQNNLETLELGLLDKLSNLRIFNASFCSLKTFTDGMLDKNPYLHSLDISSNSIRDLFRLIFTDNRDLTFFNASHNYIETLNPAIFLQTIIKILDISYNKFETIPSGILNKQTLQEVFLQHNKLYFFQQNKFSSSLQYLNIVSNRFIFLESKLLDSLKKLKVFEIFGNPWDCKCLDLILEKLDGKEITYNKKDYFDGKKPLCVVGSFETCRYIDRVNWYSIIENYEIKFNTRMKN